MIMDKYCKNLAPGGKMCERSEFQGKFGLLLKRSNIRDTSWKMPREEIYCFRYALNRIEYQLIEGRSNDDFTFRPALRNTVCQISIQIKVGSHLKPWEGFPLGTKGVPSIV